MKNHFTMKINGVGYVERKPIIRDFGFEPKKTATKKRKQKKKKENKQKKTIYLDEKSEKLDDVLASDC